MFTSSALVDAIVSALALSSLAVCWVVLVVRIIGLRAFSKMTAFDFVVTVATGSLLAGASQATSWAAYLQATVSVASLLLVQYLVAELRGSSRRFANLVQNAPVLLMHDGEILHRALQATRVAEDDLIAKLRERNVLKFSDVSAVVLETTGDISVLQGGEVQALLLDDVQRIT